uniref:Uncharacterized protein n=1 Tax=Theileria parva TaxID=5875 RepID=Q4N1F9_THEPA|eukprot:XP_764422.1 hypothetical protein [Theileria parva strain Muguga]
MQPFGAKTSARGSLHEPVKQHHGDCEKADSPNQHKPKIRLGKKHNRNSKYLGVSAPVKENNQHTKRSESPKPSSAHSLTQTSQRLEHVKNEGRKRKLRMNKAVKNSLFPSKGLIPPESSLLQMDPDMYYAERLYNMSNYKNTFLQYGHTNQTSPTPELDDSFFTEDNFFLSDQIKLPIYVGFFLSGFFGLILLILLAVWLWTVVRTGGQEDKGIDEYTKGKANDDGLTLAEFRSTNPNLVTLGDYLLNGRIEAENDYDERHYSDENTDTDEDHPSPGEGTSDHNEEGNLPEAENICEEETYQGFEALNSPEEEYSEKESDTDKSSSSKVVRFENNGPEVIPGPDDINYDEYIDWDNEGYENNLEGADQEDDDSLDIQKLFG